MSMWTDMMAAEAAMREATTLIDEQRAAIDDLHGALAGLLGLCQLIQHRADMTAETRDALSSNHRMVEALAMYAKHAPAQSQEQPK